MVIYCGIRRNKDIVEKKSRLKKIFNEKVVHRGLTNEKLSELTGLSVSSVKKYIAMMVESGEVSITMETRHLANKNSKRKYHRPYRVFVVAPEPKPKKMPHHAKGGGFGTCKNPQERAKDLLVILKGSLNEKWTNEHLANQMGCSIKSIQIYLNILRKNKDIVTKNEYVMKAGRYFCTRTTSVVKGIVPPTNMMSLVGAIALQKLTVDSKSDVPYYLKDDYQHKMIGIVLIDPYKNRIYSDEPCLADKIHRQRVASMDEAKPHRFSSIESIVRRIK